MQKPIVTTIGEISHSIGSTTSGGTFTITSLASLNTKAEGNYIYRGEVLFSFLGGNSAETLGGTGIVVPGTVYGTGSISPSATKCKNDGLEVVLEDDSGSFITLFGTFTLTSTGVPVPNTPIPPTDVYFSSAGQNKVLGS
jgi:hypothetical protein